jgi:hypothetical protein
MSTKIKPSWTFACCRAREGVSGTHVAHECSYSAVRLLSRIGPPDSYSRGIDADFITDDRSAATVLGSAARPVASICDHSGYFAVNGNNR